MICYFFKDSLFNEKAGYCYYINRDWNEDFIKLNKNQLDYILKCPKIKKFKYNVYKVIFKELRNLDNDDLILSELSQKLFKRNSDELSDNELEILLIKLKDLKEMV